jgi:hypothetical protein
MMQSELKAALIEVAAEENKDRARRIADALDDAESGHVLYEALEAFYRSGELDWLDRRADRHLAFAEWALTPDAGRRVQRLFGRLRREARRRELLMIRTMADAELANLYAAKRSGTFTVEATLHVPWSGTAFIDWTRTTRPTAYKPV